jgi:glycosyltransferase involved in cell wall biosynthesis
MVIGMSPLHLSEMEKHLHIKFGPKGYAYLQEIDTELFRNLNLKRTIENLYTGSINAAKGVDIIRAKYKDLAICNNLPYEDMPEWYNSSINYVFEPRWFEPFNRGAAEAALCGCNLVTNEKVGALSFGKNLADPLIYLEGKNDLKSKLSQIIT